MDKYKYVMQELKRRASARQLTVVSAKVDISRRTLTNILAGKDTLMSNITALHDYFKKNEKKDVI